VPLGTTRFIRQVSALFINYFKYLFIGDIIVSEVATYEITGELLNDTEARPFMKQVKANTEHHARELVYTLFGSKQKIKRREIKINSVKTVKEEKKCLKLN